MPILSLGGILIMFEDIFGYDNCGGDGSWMSRRIEARDAMKHPTMHQRAGLKNAPSLDAVMRL